MDHLLALSTSAPAGLLKFCSRREWLFFRRSTQAYLSVSRLVDIISYHYYGSGDIKRVKKDCELAKKHGKV